MKPPQFEYAAPATLDEALALLAEGDGEAKALSGGQSLMPVLAFRLASPSLLVDLRRIPDLDRIEIDARGVRMGAKVRWRDIERDARLATALHPLGALLLVAFGGLPFAAAVFAVLHGAGNGMITIAKGTLPLALFGPDGYGLQQGWLGVGARTLQACAPWTFGLLLEARGGVAALALTCALSLFALGCLLGLRSGRVR
jgi:hypothetical protein